MGFHFQHKGYELVFFRITFYVELGAYDLADFAYIVIPYVPFVGPWVHSNAVGTKQLAVYSGFYHIWLGASAAVAQCSDLVYING
jgi:hypothetical protein